MPQYVIGPNDKTGKTRYGLMVDGGTVNQWTDNGGLNQQWSIVDLNNGYFKDCEQKQR